MTEAPTERAIQKAVVHWLRLSLPRGSIVSASVNEAAASARDDGARARFYASRKAAGVVTGFPDITICLPGGSVKFLELKRPGSGRLSAEQDEVRRSLEALGHTVMVADSIEVTRYLLRFDGVPLSDTTPDTNDLPVRAARLRDRVAAPRQSARVSRIARMEKIRRETGGF